MQRAAALLPSAALQPEVAWCPHQQWSSWAAAAAVIERLGSRSRASDVVVVGAGDASKSASSSRFARTRVAVAAPAPAAHLRRAAPERHGVARSVSDPRFGARASPTTPFSPREGPL